MPYIRYIELDVQAMGLTVPKCGFLMVRDPAPEESGPENYELFLDGSKAEKISAEQQGKKEQSKPEKSPPVFI